MMEAALDWKGDGLPPGALLLIKDCVAAKGGFMLIYFLKKLLIGGRVVFVSLVEPFSHYNRIAKKQGCNLIQCRENGQLVFVDAMAGGNQLNLLVGSGREEVLGRGNSAGMGSAESGAEAGPSKSHIEAVSPLQMLYQRVNESVKKLQTDSGKDRTVIMIDDASLLEIAAGGRPEQVLSFLQYCRALFSGEHRCSVVVLVHGDTDITYGAAEFDSRGPVGESGNVVASLPQELEHTADVVISVDPLSTGLARDVHGQVTVIHWTDALSSRDSRKGVQTLQFKLMENNTLFFHPGGRI